MIQDVVSPHCGDKRMPRRGTISSLPNYFVMTSNHWYMYITLNMIVSFI